MNPQIISETPIDSIELQEEVAKIKKRDATPSFRVIRTEEYLLSFSLPNKSEGGELFNKLMKMDVPRLKELHIRKIIDIMPAAISDLKVLLQGYSVTVSNENLKKIVDLVREYIPEK